MEPVPGLGGSEAGRARCLCGLLEEPEVPEVFFGPAGLLFDHALEGFRRKRVSRVVKRNHHSSAIGVTVSLVTARLGPEEKAISAESADQVAGGEGPEP